MAVKFNKLLLCLLIAIHVVAPESTEVIHVVAPVYKEYAAVGVMINSFLSQTNDNWTLTFVSDGIDERMEALVKLYSSIPLLGDNIHDNSPDVRIKYMNTPYRTNDGGHSPRALGLSSLTNTGWTVLSGGDNYYCPLFIASLLDVITVPNNIGFIYWDFVLDRKGNQLPPSITDESKNTDKYLVSIPIVIGDISHDLSFNEHDDLHLLAHTFATQHGLMEGGGCEAGSEASGTSCVTHRLIVAMQGELERALTGQQPSWKELPDRYADTHTFEYTPFLHPSTLLHTWTSHF